jgi:hypothetical protein
MALTSFLFNFSNTIDDVTGGAAYVYDIDNDEETVTFVQKLTKEELNENATFGYSVSVSGDYIVVGAPYYDGDELSEGGAYIYHKGANDWDLFSPEPAQDAIFGWSVAVNSDGVIAVGAPGNRGYKGSVYIFKRQGTVSWKHVFTLEPKVSSLAYFGSSVAIDDE